MNIKIAKYKLSRRMTFRGLPISVETDKGELRHWFDPHENKSGTTKMKVPYGYIRRTEGVDGDHVDCYVGPNERARNVYIIHQMKAPEFKVYDEDKCMLGFTSADAAKSAYLAHYNKPGFFGSMTTMPFEEFEKKVKATFEAPKKIAEEAMSSTYLKYARDLGARLALEEFRKQADAALGDPNYWSGGTQAQQAPPQPASAEEAIQLLPGGTFQGLQMKITPDGQRSTTVKVTPEATQDPTGLNSIFSAEPGAKVEVSNPEEAVPGTQVASPGGPESGGMPPEGAMPAEGAMPPKLGVARIKASSYGDVLSAIPFLPGNQILSGTDAPKGQGLRTFGWGIGGEALGGGLGALAGSLIPGGKPLGGLVGAGIGGYTGRQHAKKDWPLLSRMARD